MRHNNLTALIGLAFVAGGCADAGVSAPTQTETDAIVNGEQSPPSEDNVIHLSVDGLGTCSGTLIAPNVVLTAMHCVTHTNTAGSFTCNLDGTVSTSTPPNGEFGASVEPESIIIRTGFNAANAEPAAYGARVFTSRSLVICHNDIALVVLDRDLPTNPVAVRLEQPTFAGEKLRVIGYGVGSSPSGTRGTRAPVYVTDVGEYGDYEMDGRAAPHTFVIGQGPCNGDSGGPALSEETGAIVGVYSIIGAGCSTPGVRNIYTQTGPFRQLVTETLEYAGHEPLLEPGPAGEGGAGGEGPEPGAGGEAASAAGQPGNESGGTGAVGAAGTGEGATGNVGATSSEGGSGNDGPGSAGEPAMGATGGTTPNTGSGSREDPSCGCRLETNSQSPGGWASLLALVGLTWLRRARRTER